MRKLLFSSFALFLLLLLVPSITSAHSGGTDANGGHHCWTNCGYYGYEYGEYHYHNGGYDDSYDYVDYEKQLRQQYLADAVGEGNYLLTLLNNFNAAISSGDIKKIDGLYDEFSSQLSYVESLIGYVYGSDQRAQLNDKYIKPAKVAKERVIYEVSQLRLLSDINYYINEDYWVDDEFAMLERLVKRAEQIKKAGGYKAIPAKVNQYLRLQDAIIQGNYLNSRTSYFKEVINSGYISDVHYEYDDFTKQIQRTQAKIGKVYGSETRNKLDRTYVKPAIIEKERVIYEVSQYRLLQQIEDLYYSGDSSEISSLLSKLDRLQKRAIEIKAAGGYQVLPTNIDDELQQMETWVRS